MLGASHFFQTPKCRSGAECRGPGGVVGPLPGRWELRLVRPQAVRRSGRELHIGEGALVYSGSWIGKLNKGHHSSFQNSSISFRPLVVPPTRLARLITCHYRAQLAIKNHRNSSWGAQVYLDTAPHLYLVCIIICHRSKQLDKLSAATS